MNTTTYTRNEQGLVTHVFEPDPDGDGPLGASETVSDYDGRGRLLSTTYADLSSESWEYDLDNGQVTDHIDRAGVRTHYDLDAFGNVETEILVVGELDDGINLETDDIVLAERTYTQGLTGIPNGLILTETDAHGHVTKYEYYDDESGNLHTVTYAFGTEDAATTTYEYDAAGNVTAEIDPLERRTEHVYDALDRRIQTILPDPDGALGPLTSAELFWDYCVCGALNWETDANGVKTSYGYDKQKRVISTTITNPDDEYDFVTTLTGYDAAGNMTSQTLVIGELDDEFNLETDDQITSYIYNAANRLVETVLPDPDGAGPLTSPHTFQTYDARGNLKTSTDARGAVTTYVHDAMNRVIETHSPDPDGAGPLGPLVNETHYNEFGQVDFTTSPLGVTSYEYDPRGRRTKVTRPDPDGAGPLHAPITLTAYDDAGLVISTTEVVGEIDDLVNLETDDRVTTYGYDDRDRQVHVILPDPDGDPIGTPFDAPEQFYVYDLAGQLITFIQIVGEIDDEINEETNDQVTSYEYDGLGRQTLVTLPDPDGPGVDYVSPVRHMTYDDAGNLLTEAWVIGELDDDVNLETDDVTTTYEYDYLGRRKHVIGADPDGDPGSGDPAPEWFYEYDAAGNLVEIIDPLDRVTTYDYDKLGRRIKVTLPDPDGPGTEPEHALPAPVYVTRYDAAGNVTSQIVVIGELDDDVNLETNDLVTAYEYDALGRRTSVVQPNGDTTTYAYNDQGLLESLIDGEENETSWQYDALGRMTTETNAYGDREFSYDDAGNLASQTDRNGRIRTFEYDSLHRRRFEKWHDPGDFGTIIYTAEMIYDRAGQLLSIADDHSAYTYEHDHLGRVTTITQTLEGLAEPVLLSQRYDELGRRAALEAVIGETGDFVNDYLHDNLGRMTRVTQTALDELYGNAVLDKRVDLTHKADSQLDTITRYASALQDNLGVTSAYGYDLAGRLTSLVHSPADDDDVEYSWVYDQASRITQQVSPDGTQNYGYDAAGQLTSASLTSESYSYDNNGNRDYGDYETDAGNRLAYDGTYHYAYDAEGNRTLRYDGSGNARVYEYDFRNRLTAVRDYTSATVIDDEFVSGTLAMEAEYLYDALNQRIAKSVDDDGAGVNDPVATWFIFAGGSVGLSQIVLALDDAGAIEHRYLWGPGVDQLLADDSVSDLVWTLTDNLGSIRDTVNAAGELVDHVAYTAFGQPLDPIPTLFGYTGAVFDIETGMGYHRARYYDSAVGEWINEDPIGFRSGLVNLNVYVGNRAINSTDPTGLVEYEEVGKRVVGQDKPEYSFFVKITGPENTQGAQVNEVTRTMTQEGPAGRQDIVKHTISIDPIPFGASGDSREVQFPDGTRLKLKGNQVVDGHSQPAINTQSKRDPRTHLVKVVIKGTSTLYEVTDIKGELTIHGGFQTITLPDGTTITATDPTGGAQLGGKPSGSALVKKKLGSISWTYEWEETCGKGKGSLDVSGLKNANDGKEKVIK